MSFFDTTPSGRIMNRFSKGKFPWGVRYSPSFWCIVSETPPSSYSALLHTTFSDIYTIDEALPSSFQMYLDCMFQVMSTLVVVTTVTPWFSIVLLPMLVFYRTQQAYFAQCYRELKRIDSVTRSPIYALFGETLDGKKMRLYVWKSRRCHSARFVF